jgi:hypothetical protein
VGRPVCCTDVDVDGVESKEGEGLGWVGLGVQQGSRALTGAFFVTKAENQ